jgi:hypothetical protein
MTKDIFNFRSLLDKEKLNEHNFLDWERNLGIVLRMEGKQHVLETPIPVLDDNSTKEEIDEERSVRKKAEPVTCLMLATMEPTLQEQFIDMDAYSMMRQLREMFQKQSRLERFETSKAIMDMRLEKGKPVGPHVRQMIRLMGKLAKLGFPYSQQTATDTILHSLHSGFNQFKMNYNMNGWDKTLEELHSMLLTAEKDVAIVGTKKDVLMVQKDKGFKKGGKQKKKTASKGKSKRIAKPKDKGPPPDTKCFYCDGKGHWKRNCPKFLEDKKNGTVASNSGINS